MIFRGRLKSLLTKSWNSPRSPSLCRSLGGFLALLSFPTVLAANFGCDLLKSMPEIVFSSFWAPPSEVAILCNWNPCSSIGLQSRFVCMHWLQLETCHFAPMQYFIRDEENLTNEWLKAWAKEWGLIWFVTCSCKSPKNSCFVYMK